MVYIIGIISYTIFIFIISFQDSIFTIYISRLDKDKLIKRIINNVDKRTTTISLTKKGQDIIDSIYEVIDKYLVANNLDFAVNPPAALLEFNYMSQLLSHKLP